MEITEEQFPLESEVQRLTEPNLQDLFDLVFVRSEFELHGLRIDTLAFNKESGNAQRYQPIHADSLKI